MLPTAVRMQQRACLAANSGAYCPAGASAVLALLFEQPVALVTALQTCVDYYEVRMVEDGPTPRAVSNVPSQTRETSVQVKGLRPGQEYL